MTEKQTYWLADADGRKAIVEGAADRDYWTKVQGWTETVEPGPTDIVYVVHEVVGRGQLAYGAVKDGWSELGWSYGGPPMPVDLTKDPHLVDQVDAATPDSGRAADAAPAGKPSTGKRAALSGQNEE